jgi:hypothetical protein
MIGFEVFSTVAVKSAIFCVVTPCVSEEYSACIFSLSPPFAGFFLGLLFDPEDEADLPPKRQRLSKLCSVTNAKTVIFSVNKFVFSFFSVFIAMYSGLALLIVMGSGRCINCN